MTTAFAKLADLERSIEIGFVVSVSVQLVSPLYSLIPVSGRPLDTEELKT